MRSENCDTDYEGLAAQFGSPFYVYDMDAALQHLAAFKAHLPACVDVYFAMKANPNPAVLRAFHPHVDGLDISSAGELDLAREVGFSAGAMSFAGPGKSEHELARAVQARAGVVSVESHAELERLMGVARKTGTRPNITLRINPETIPNAFAMKMGGRASQFGIAEEEIDGPLDAAKSSADVNLCGLHIYAGTQCLEIDAIVENLRQTLAITRRLVSKHRFEPQIVNLGGGFGVAYFARQTALDNSALAKAVGEIVDQFVHDNRDFSKTRFILELGRYLIGPFGTYVARVIEIKETRGKRFAIMDGGMHHCFPATGNFGQLVKKNYPVTNASRATGQMLPHELVGPLCTPLDSMARAIELPSVESGDLIAFENCGAYALTASPLFFLSHATPVEIVRANSTYALARETMAATRFM